MFEAARQPEQYGYMAANANPPFFARLAGSRFKRGHFGRMQLSLIRWYQKAVRPPSPGKAA
jgi:hypothetical protein